MFAIIKRFYNRVFKKVSLIPKTDFSQLTKDERENAILILALAYTSIENDRHRFLCYAVGTACSELQKHHLGLIFLIHRSLDGYATYDSYLCQLYRQSVVNKKVKNLRLKWIGSMIVQLRKEG